MLQFQDYCVSEYGSCLLMMFFFWPHITIMVGIDSLDFTTFQLLDAVSRMACLGFEKSYRETIVLMTRSYLDKLKSLGSAEEKALPQEATTERIEVCIRCIWELCLCIVVNISNITILLTLIYFLDSPDRLSSCCFSSYQHEIEVWLSPSIIIIMLWCGIGCWIKKRKVLNYKLNFVS